eukprot:scaffold202180_cov16-Prasinocladus_malaysianus.AAC.1
MQVVVVKAGGSAGSKFTVHCASKQELRSKEVKLLPAACFNHCNEEGISTFGNAGKIWPRGPASRPGYTRQLSAPLCR